MASENSAQDNSQHQTNMVSGNLDGLSSSQSSESMSTLSDPSSDAPIQPDRVATDNHSAVTPGQPKQVATETGERPSDSNESPIHPFFEKSPSFTPANSPQPPDTSTSSPEVFAVAEGDSPRTAAGKQLATEHGLKAVEVIKGKKRELDADPRNPQNQVLADEPGRKKSKTDDEPPTPKTPKTPRSPRKYERVPLATIAPMAVIPKGERLLGDLSSSEDEAEQELPDRNEESQQGMDEADRTISGRRNEGSEGEGKEAEEEGAEVTKDEGTTRTGGKDGYGKSAAGGAELQL